MSAYIKREVTATRVKLAKVKLEKGVMITEKLDDVVLPGNVTKENAEKRILKEFGSGVTVLSVEVETHKYQMDVLDFIQKAAKLN